MINNDLLILFIVIPLFFSFFPLIEKIKPALKMSKAASLLSFILSTLLLAAFTAGISQGAEYKTVVGGWTIIAGISQRLDGISWIGLALMYAVSFPSLLYSFSEKSYSSIFYFFFLVLHAGMAGMVLAYDIFNLFVFLEITGICAYVLIAYTQKGKAVFASFKYLMLSSLGISLFLIAVFIIYFATGSLRFDDMPKLFSSISSQSAPAAFAVAALIAGIGVRTAFIPYTWLPDAHAFAPHPVSAVLSGVVIKISFIVVWKLVTLLSLSEVRLFLLWMGCAIALIGVIRALAQTDFKVLLAWHSVSQMGFIFAAFGAGTVLSVTGSMYHAISHAFFKSLLFLSVSIVIIFSGERSLERIRGAGKYLPAASILFFIGALSITGIPPFTGYVSKKLIFSGLKDYPAAYLALFIASIGTVASFTKLSLIFRGKISSAMKDKDAAINTRRFTGGYAGMTILAIFCIAAGVFGTYISRQIALLIYGPEILSVFNPKLWNDTAEYMKTAFTVLAGIILYKFVMSKAGKKLQEAAGRITVCFDSQLVLLFCGFLALSLFLYRY